MSSKKIDSSFSPKSNAFKNILKEPKEEKRSFGKEEFLARRRFFLEKLENEGGIPKPKPFVNKLPTVNKKASFEQCSASFNKNIKLTTNIKTTPSIKTSQSNLTKIIEKEKAKLPVHEWSISSAKSESLRKIIDLANKGETNTVGKSVFSARQKFFADSQLSNVDQLMPRPSTPPGYSYIERCPSPSFEPSNRRHSYSMYSTSQSLSSSPIISSPKPASPSLSKTTVSLPWEHSNKKKEIFQPKPQTQMNVIKFLEKHSLISEKNIELPEPVIFSKELLSIDEPITIQIKNVKPLNPMIAKILESSPEYVQFNIETLPDDKLMYIDIIIVKNIEPQFPKHFFALPDPVKFEKVFISSEEPLEVVTEFIPMPIKNIAEFIHILPEPVKVTNLLLPQDEPFNVETVNVIPAEKQIPETVKMVVEEFFNERNDLKSDLIKTTGISSLTLESNIEAKKETKKAIYTDILSSQYSSETQLLTETMDEKQPILDFDTENISNNITENSSINSSISEFLNNNGTIYLDDPLPRKSIPTYGNSEEQFNLIDLSENDVTDKIKNWYNVVDNAINEEK